MKLVMKAFVLFIGLYLIPVAHSGTRTTVTITEDLGGNVRQYIQKALLYEQASVKLEIEGKCASACTILISSSFNYEKCMSRHALFGFHKPYILGKLTQEQKDGLALTATAMWDSYHPIIQSNLRVQGWPSVLEGDPQDKLVWLSAEELRGILPYCDGGL